MKKIFVLFCLTLSYNVYALTPTPTVTATSIPTQAVMHDDNTGIYTNGIISAIIITLSEADYKAYHEKLDMFALITIPTKDGYLLLVRGKDKDIKDLIKDFSKVKPIKNSDKSAVRSKYGDFDKVDSAISKILQVEK
jgi:hypothetical protein